MELSLCAGCGQHVLQSVSSCPHCLSRFPSTSSRIPTAAALLMGLGMAGCDQAVEDIYGVPNFDTAFRADEDGDGFSVVDDCDDEDSSIYPGAEEIPGDGIDQNCNGDDDD
jgi:hypothetical protein